MKTLNFTKFISSIKKSYFVIATLAVAMGVSVGIAHAEFYPNRTPYDYNVPCDAASTNKYTRCGSLTGPVFNSFINTPSYGDERAFVDARRTDQTASGSYKNVLSDVKQGSKEVIVRMYVHNNANQSTNASGTGVARNTTVRIDLPSAQASSLRARGYISASNATPNLVEDTVDFTSGEAFKVSYIPGSATLVNNQGFKNGTKLSDSIVSTGALIGSNALDGTLPGCFEYEGIVEIRVKVTPAPKPAVTFTKQVNNATADGWMKNVTVKPGDKLKWLLSFKDTGNTELTNVRISDQLPPHVQLVPGSVRYIDAAQNVVQSDTGLFGTGGINFNKWAPNGGFYVRFETTVKSDFPTCTVNIRNIAYNNTDQTPQGQDTADVTITKPNCTPPTTQTPAYTCEKLTVTPQGNNKYVFNTAYTATNGAVFSNVEYAVTVDNKALDLLTATTGNNTEYTLLSGTNYTVKATPYFTVDGKKVAASASSACTVSFTKSAPPTTPIVPVTPVAIVAQPTKLVNTGAGSVAAMFALVSVAGTFAYRFYLGRRLV